MFPWERSARDGEPFSPRYVPVPQGSGRFDLGDTPVWYLAESVEHAVAESLQAFRGRDFDDRMLSRFGRPLARMNVVVPEPLAASIANLDDGAELARLGITPSTLASDDRRRTQAVARTVFDSGASGMRWWSKLSGDWHTTILFLSRVPVISLELEEPVLLTRDHETVSSACRHLGILMR